VVSSYLLTDMSYALAISKFRNDSGTDRRWYYLGAAAAMWGVWQIATAVGALLGTNVPSEWGIGFAVPLVFLSLLVSDVSDRPRLVAAVVGGGVAVVGGAWPLNLGLIGGALAGVTAGAAVDNWGRDA